MNKDLESELLDRVVASAIVSVGTKYVVEVERELLLLRLEVIEKGNSIGNIELIGAVEERLRIVQERMNGLSGEVLRVMMDVKRELSRLGRTTNTSVPKGTSKKRGRPAKNSSGSV